MAFIEPITLALAFGRIQPQLADRGLIGLSPFQEFKRGGPATGIIPGCRPRGRARTPRADRAVSKGGAANQAEWLSAVELRRTG